MRAALALAQRPLLGAQSGENGNTRSRPLCSGVTAIHDSCPSQSRARSSPDALRSRFGISLPRRRSIALRAEQEQLRKILPTARKWEVGERPCYRHQADNKDPQLPLPRCKRLPVDAGNRAVKNDQPNRGKAHPNLAVELRGVQTKTGKNFAHGLDHTVLPFIDRACANFLCRRSHAVLQRKSCQLQFSSRSLSQMALPQRDRRCRADCIFPHRRRRW